MTVAESELWIESHDGTNLFARSWIPQTPRGTVLISHGLGEHTGRYAHVAEALAEPEVRFATLAFDYRAHGRSPGRRGAISSFDDMLDDLRAGIATLARNEMPRPWIVLGHSQGGLIALRALNASAPIDGLILSSPALEVRIKVSLWKRALAHVLRLIAPSLPIDGSVPAAWLATRPGYDDARRADPLVHGKVCANVYFGLKEWGPRLLAAAPTLTTPLLVVVGAHDQITSADAASKLVSRWGGPVKQLLVSKISAHEPLNDVDQALVLSVIELWLRERAHDAGSGFQQQIQDPAASHLKPAKTRD